jgi:hypothetical protein
VLRDHALRLRGLSNRWADLERRIKEAEQLNESVKVAAINELRYTGRRFMDAWLIASKEEKDITDEDRIEFDTHIRLAEQYFINSDHDLSDSIITFFSERRLLWLEKYGLKNAIEMYPFLHTWVAQLEEARSIVRSSREDRTARIDGYKRIVSEIIPDLITRYRDIINSEALYLARYRRERLIRQIERAIVVISLLAALLTVWSHWDHTWFQITSIFKPIR